MKIPERCFSLILLRRRPEISLMIFWQFINLRLSGIIPMLFGERMATP